jgi:hypothetical protein
VTEKRGILAAGKTWTPASATVVDVSCSGRAGWFGGEGGEHKSELVECKAISICLTVFMGAFSSPQQFPASLRSGKKTHA